MHVKLNSFVKSIGSCFNERMEAYCTKCEAIMQCFLGEILRELSEDQKRLS